MLKVGLKGTAESKVDEKNTARAIKSGDLPVYATPSMVALMEEASCNCVSSEAEDGETTVGIKMDVSHLSATPLGMTVKAESVLEEIDGKKLIFSVKAFDEAGLIGEGKHERFVVNRERFMSRTEGKKKKPQDKEAT